MKTTLDRGFDQERSADRITHDVGFPETEHEPPTLPQFAHYFAISHAVPGDLRDPILSVVSLAQFRRERIPAPAVPEIAVAEHCDASPCKRQIRFAGEIRPKRAEAKPLSPHLFSQEQLRLRVLARIGTLCPRCPFRRSG